MKKPVRWSCPVLSTERVWDMARRFQNSIKQPPCPEGGDSALMSQGFFVFCFFPPRAAGGLGRELERFFHFSPASRQGCTSISPERRLSVSFQKPSRESALATPPDSSFSLFTNLLGRFYHHSLPLAVLACGLSACGAGEAVPPACV